MDAIGYIHYYKTGSRHPILKVVESNDFIIKLIIYNKWFKGPQARTVILDPSIEIVLN